MDPASIYIINYNGERVLRETIQSVKTQDYPNKTITLIDDGSTDRSISLVKDGFPDVEIIGLSYNTGFPNKLRCLAIERANTRYIFLIDNDIVLEKDCLSNLMQTIKSSQDIGLCTPRLMYYNDRDRIYVSWTKWHYLCASISPLRDTMMFDAGRRTSEDTIGGGTMLLDREKMEVVGNIDDSYPMGWGEDAEIYARMKIAGYRTLYVPNAVGYHHAKPFVTERRPNAFGQARNRWTMILTMYQIRTIILILPVLIIYEALTILMLIQKKMAGSYLTGILNAAIKKRGQIQSTRKARDREFLTSGPIYIPGAYIQNPLYKTGFKYLNKIFHIYWLLIK